MGDLISPTYIFLRRTWTINDTKIKYIKVNDTKLYEVEKISFFDFSIEALETDLKVEDMPEQEVFDISYFMGYRIKLKNK